MTDEDSLWSGTVFRSGDADLKAVSVVDTDAPSPEESNSPAFGVRIHEPADQYPKISFKVHGIPRPQGSKRAFVNKKTGKAIVTEQNAKTHASFREDVASAAEDAMAGHPQLETGVILTVTFVFPRPKGHLRKDGSVSPTAPPTPATRSVGDCSKLVRSIEDSMSTIVYRDDSQVTTIHANKAYGVAVGTYIQVEPDC